MGNAQTATVDGVPVRSVADEGVSADLHVVTPSGVRVSTPQIDMQRALQEAYEKGKAESQASVQSMLEAVAADVYDNVHAQLADIQTKQALQAADLAASLKVKLSNVQVQRRTVCDGERSALLACLSSRPGDLLACEQLASAYSTCASDLN